MITKEKLGASHFNSSTHTSEGLPLLTFTEVREWLREPEQAADYKAVNRQINAQLARMGCGDVRRGGRTWQLALRHVATKSRAMEDRAAA